MLRYILTNVLVILSKECFRMLKYVLIYAKIHANSVLVILERIKVAFWSRYMLIYAKIHAQ